MNRDQDSLAEEQLDALLDALPREDVPATFATGVTRRIDARRRRSARRRTLVAAAVVAALGTSTWLTHDHRNRSIGAAREAAMRLELRQLGAELERLEQQRARARPVVFLGATEDVDIVVDLYRLATSRALEHSVVGAPPNNPTHDLPTLADEYTNASSSGEPKP